MPALPRFRVGSLEAIATQLRFGSGRTLRREIERAEQLAAELDAEQLYPESWLIFTLTGYRPEEDSGAVVPGAAVLADLSTLVEHLCADAGYGPDDAPADAIGVAELAERWGVSRKTIERSRRRGLVARRVSLGGGLARLVFTPAAIEAYERRRGETIERAATFERLTGAAKSELLKAARRHAAERRSLFDTASRLAPEFGRTTEGVRQLFLRHDEAERAKQDGSPIFAAPHDRGARTRLAVLRAVRAGEEPSAISASLFNGALTRRQVTLLATGCRERLLARLRLDAPTSPVFDRDDASAVLLAHASVREGLGSAMPAMPLADWLAAARDRRPDPPQLESARASAYLYLLHRARAARAAGLTAVELDAVETDLRWARLIRADLIGGQAGVVLAALESAAGVPLEQLGRVRLRFLVLEGLRAAGHAVDHFNPFRGARLAAAVGLAMGRLTSSISRDPGDARPGAGRATRTVVGGGGTIDPDTLSPSPAWSAWLAPPPGCRAIALDPGSVLSDRHRLILTRRHGLDGRPPATLDELAGVLGTPRLHAARSERAALRHLAKLAARSDLPSGHG